MRLLPGRLDFSVRPVPLPSHAGSASGRDEPRGPQGLDLEPTLDPRVLALPRSESSPLTGQQRLVDASRPTPELPSPARSGTRDPHALTDLSLAASEEASSLDASGTGDRLRPEHPENYPWRAICHLRITAADRSSLLGTGWLAAPRLVITAGHCVFQRFRGGWAQSIEVTPGRNGAKPPRFGTFLVGRSGLRSVRGWTRDADHHFDYGAIVIPRSAEDPSPGDQAGFFGFHAPPADELRRGLYNLAGYPDDLEEATLWWHARGLHDVQPNTLLYTMDTQGGQSGAPVWRRVDGKVQVVGIHSGDLGTVSQAVRINSQVYSNLVSWKRDAS